MAPKGEVGETGVTGLPRPVPPYTPLPRRQFQQGEAQRANSKPNGGPHLELLLLLYGVYGLRLKTWSKTEIAIAQTTGQHFRTMYTPIFFHPI